MSSPPSERADESVVERWFAPEVSPDLTPVSQPLAKRSVLVGRNTTPREPPPPPVTDAEIEALRQAARAEGLAQGHAEGLAKGLADGHAQAQEQVVAQARHLANVLESVVPVVESLDQELEQELVALVIAVARQLIRRELRSDPSQIMAAIREALPLLPAYSRGVRLFLHPEDAVLVRESLNLSQELESWKLLEDPSVSRGGARLESETARLDATVESRFNAVIAEVFGGTRRGEAGGASRDSVMEDRNALDDAGLADANYEQRPERDL